MQCPCNNFIKSKGKSREREESERSEEEEGKHRKESNKEGKIAKARRINETKGKALPNFQIEDDMKGAVTEQMEEITEGDGPFWVNVGDSHPPKALNQAGRCARLVPSKRAGQAENYV